MDREPLALMSAAERTDYCRWLRKLAAKRRGSIATRLRQAADELSGRNCNAW